MSATDTEQPNTLSTWIGFAATCLGMFMAILDVQIVVTSLPTIGTALDIPKDQMSWIQTAYLIAEVIAIPLTGWLTRVLTMRGLFVAAIAGFTLASIGCAGSNGFVSLVSWRIAQGFCGGTLIPIVFSAVFLLFPHRTQGIATTIAGVLAVLAPTVGPIASGWITETFSWHWLFLVNVPAGIVSIFVGAKMLPHEKSNLGLARTLDWRSLISIAIALAAIEIAVKEGPHRGWTSTFAIVTLTASVTFGFYFLRRSLGVGRDFIDITLFKNRNFAVGCAMSFMLGMALFGMVYLMPIFLFFVHGYGPFRIGEIMLVTGILQLLTAPIAVTLERNNGAKLLTGIGFALFALGLGASYFQTYETDFWGMYWPQVIRGSAIMLCLLPPIRLALGYLGPEHVPQASGIFNLMRNLGGAIGIGLIDTVIWERAPAHADHIVARLLAGDASMARFVGLPTEPFTGKPMGPIDSLTKGMVEPLVERAAFVASVNEAWAMLAFFMLLALLALPFAKATGKPGGEMPFH